MACRLCPDMEGGPVHGCTKKKTKIVSIGQAPGIHEEKFGKPFAYTAGKTLFKWFETIGVDEETFRSRVNMAAVCRCFPGKLKNGDRKPNRTEVENCSRHLQFEIQYHRPELIIPIGRLAIDQLHGTKYKLKDITGHQFHTEYFGVPVDYIPLPHPSGLNVWLNTDEGKTLTRKALALIIKHKAFKATFS